MGDEDEVEPTQLELASLGGDVENFQVPSETITQVESAEKVVLVDPDAEIADDSEEDTADGNIVKVQAGVVNVPGTWQSVYDDSCGEWNPACAGTYLAEQADGTFSGAFDVPAGAYEVKVALNGSWDENYGDGGVQNGANYQFEVDESGHVTFSYDPQSHLLTIT